MQVASEPYGQITLSGKIKPTDEIRAMKQC